MPSMAPRRTAQALDARMAPQTICCLCRMAQTQPCGCVLGVWGCPCCLLDAALPKSRVQHNRGY